MPSFTLAGVVGSAALAFSGKASTPPIKPEAAKKERRFKREWAVVFFTRIGRFIKKTGFEADFALQFEGFRGASQAGG